MIMTTLNAHIKNGQVFVDDTTTHPDGAVKISILDDDESDDFAHLDEEERKALVASLERGWQQVKAGKYRPAEEVMSELRARHR